MIWCEKWGKGGIEREMQARGCGGWRQGVGRVRTGKRDTSRFSGPNGSTDCGSRTTRMFAIRQTPNADSRKLGLSGLFAWTTRAIQAENMCFYDR
jgi:hypothetical protein